MQIGIIGLQNSGKTTLFNTISGNQDDPTAAKQEVARAVVKVPDARLDKLTDMFQPKKQIFATMEVLDIPGLSVSEDGKVKITNDFLNKVKNNDALLHIVRQFSNDAVPHPEDTIDPLRDIRFLEEEFLLSDIVLVERRLEKIEKEINKSKNEQLQREAPLFKKLQAHLNENKPLRVMEMDENERKILQGYQFLTSKPLLVGINFDDKSKDKVDALIAGIENEFKGTSLLFFPFFGQFEYELSALGAEDAEIFKADFGITESAVEKLIRQSYSLLGLHSFFTVGEDECRAWTIKKNATAQEAAGAIHSDFYQKFIRAEVVGYDDYLLHGSFPKCKEAGVWRLEGKEYIVKDGDILNIRHS